MNKRFPRIVMISLLSLVSSACSNAGLSIINTWAKLGDYELSADIAYGPSSLQTLDVYRPTGPTDNAKPKPVLVFFYGGCWGGCKTYEKAYYRFIADTFTAKGFVVAIPDYRRHPEVSIQPMLDDAAMATAWVLENIENYHGDAEQVYLIGHSAGAHLAVMTLLDPKRLGKHSQKSLAGFIGLAGPYDFLPLTEPYQEVVFGPPEAYELTQPINWVSANAPPMLLLWGEQDDSVYRHNLVNMAAKIEQLGGDVTTQLYPNIDHVGMITTFARPFRAKSAVLKDVLAFIDDAQATQTD